MQAQIKPPRHQLVALDPAALQAASCLDKIAFDQPGLARSAAKRKPGRSHYRCRHCGKWHVGRQL